MVQHGNTVHQCHHGMHDMFDEHDGGSLSTNLADQCNRIVDFAGRQTREDFVEQHQTGPCGKRPCQFQKLPLVQVQVIRQRPGLGRQAREFQPLPSLCLGFGA